VKSVVKKKRSLLSRREAIRMKMRKAVSPKTNQGGGGSACGPTVSGTAEHLIAALRCLYRHAENDGHIQPGNNPTRKVAKPRRLLSTRRAVPDTSLAEINQIAATTGNDPALDVLLLARGR
jgi:hypothetical protein